MGESYDFSGWATKNDILCADGRTIRDGAFADCDGKTVPLVWAHLHDAPENVLGHALLKNCPGEGVRCYCEFNDTEDGQLAKKLVQHQDITQLSIYANKLKQNGGDVVHGVIREVSLVMAGANPGAKIDNLSLAHSEEPCMEEAVIYTGLDSLELWHAEESKEEETETMQDEELQHEDKEETKPEEAKDGETVKDVFETLSDKQKKVVYYMIGQALEDAKGNTDKDESKEEETTEMKHNVFDQDEQTQANVLSHSDAAAILADAKRQKVGSLREFISDRLDGGELVHSVDTTGMTVATGTQTYGFNDADMLFPDYKNLNNPPEWIKRDTGWVSRVMGAVKHTPFSRIKSTYANITEDDARALGYIKGNQKKTEVFTTLKRTTDPQTVYKLQKLDRDDIIDITDFDVVAWIKAEMRVMLEEEIARAILIGDGRNSASDDKISEDHIRPIATDVPLFNTKVNVTTDNGSTDAEKAKAIIDAVIRARKNYKGSGNPTFFTTEDWLTEMLLLEDGIGHKLYKSVSELATTLRVRDIVTVEVMENQTVDSKALIGIIVNLADYNVGADKGGSVSLFDDFDIDYNQYKYLIETRISGALVKPYSALTILDNEASA